MLFPLRSCILASLLPLLPLFPAIGRMLLLAVTQAVVVFFTD